MVRYLLTSLVWVLILRLHWRCSQGRCRQRAAERCAAPAAPPPASLPVAVALHLCQRPSPLHWWRRRRLCVAAAAAPLPVAVALPPGVRRRRRPLQWRRWRRLRRPERCRLLAAEEGCRPPGPAAVPVPPPGEVPVDREGSRELAAPAAPAPPPSLAVAAASGLLAVQRDQQVRSTEVVASTSLRHEPDENCHNTETHPHGFARLHPPPGFACPHAVSPPSLTALDPSLSAMDSSPKSAGSESSRNINRVCQRRILVHQCWIRVYRQRIRVYPTLSAHDHPSLLVPGPLPPLGLLS